MLRFGGQRAAKRRGRAVAVVALQRSESGLQRLVDALRGQACRSKER
jgi:hypothetical protein